MSNRPEHTRNTKRVRISRAAYARAEKRAGDRGITVSEAVEDAIKRVADADALAEALTPFESAVREGFARGTAEPTPSAAQAKKREA
jgi:hypothetical protein